MAPLLPAFDELLRALFRADLTCCLQFQVGSCLTLSAKVGLFDDLKLDVDYLSHLITSSIVYCPEAFMKRLFRGVDK